MNIWKQKATWGSDLSQRDSSAYFVNAIEDLIANFINIDHDNFRNLLNRTPRTAKSLYLYPVTEKELINVMSSLKETTSNDISIEKCLCRTKHFPRSLQAISDNTNTQKRYWMQTSIVPYQLYQ